jgi:cytochrome c oxidase subunit 3
MTVTLVFLAALLAFFLGWVLSRTVNVEPWVADGGTLNDRMPDILTTPRVALLIFLAVASSLFALSISAYHMRMAFGDDWLAVPSPALLWVNSAILVLGSLALQWSWNAARRDDAAGLRRWLYVGGGLTSAFIIGQVLVWRDLNAGGYYMTANPANAFFYFLTALHVLHLIGGLVAWVRTAKRERAGASPEALCSSVELCTIYWHYLLVIWFILFALLLTT